MNLIFRVTPAQRLILVERAVNQMTEFTQRSWWHDEAGGVLLGRHLLDSEDLVVDKVTTPQKTDRRSRFGFFRSKRHQMLAQNRWDNEANTIAYLGLWHTHPEDNPTRLITPDPKLFMKSPAIGLHGASVGLALCQLNDSMNRIGKPVRRRAGELVVQMVSQQALQ